MDINRIEALEKRVAELEKRNSELEKRVTELKERVAELEERNAELEGRVTELEKANYDLKKENAKQQKEINELWVYVEKLEKYFKACWAGLEGIFTRSHKPYKKAFRAMATSLIEFPEIFDEEDSS